MAAVTSILVGLNSASLVAPLLAFLHAHQLSLNTVMKWSRLDNPNQQSLVAVAAALIVGWVTKRLKKKWKRSGAVGPLASVLERASPTARAAAHASGAK